MDGELHYDFVDSTGAVVATIGLFLVADSPSENPYLAQFFSGSPFDGTPTEAPVGFDLWSVFPRDGFTVRARSPSPLCLSLSVPLHTERLGSVKRAETAQ